MVKNKWSQDWFNLRFACWNCYSLSRNKFEYYKSLGYDALALTELHNKQNRFPRSKQWITSVYAELNEEDKSTDPDAIIVIMMSDRMRKILER